MARMAVGAAGKEVERTTLKAIIDRIETGLAKIRSMRSCVTGMEGELRKLRQPVGAIETENPRGARRVLVGGSDAEGQAA